MQYFISFRRDTTSRPPHALPLAHSSCSLCVTCLGVCTASSHGARHVSREEIRKLNFSLSGICSYFSLNSQSCMFMQLWRVLGTWAKATSALGTTGILKKAAGENFEALGLGTPGISNIFSFLLSSFGPPKQQILFFLLGTSMEFRDEPITLLDISFLLSVGWSRVNVSRDNSPRKVVNQHFYNLP